MFAHWGKQQRERCCGATARRGTAVCFGDGGQGRASRTAHRCAALHTHGGKIGRTRGRTKEELGLTLERPSLPTAARGRAAGGCAGSGEAVDAARRRAARGPRGGFWQATAESAAAAGAIHTMRLCRPGPEVVDGFGHSKQPSACKDLRPFEGRRREPEGAGARSRDGNARRDVGGSRCGACEEERRRLRWIAATRRRLSAAVRRGWLAGVSIFLQPRARWGGMESGENSTAQARRDAGSKDTDKEPSRSHGAAEASGQHTYICTLYMDRRARSPGTSNPGSQPSRR